MMTNVVRVRSSKSTEEFSFAGVNLTFLLVTIVLSILCINFLIIGISVIIWRWRFWSAICLESLIFPKNEKEKKRDCVHSQSLLQQPVWRVQHWGLPSEERPGPVHPPEPPEHQPGLRAGHGGDFCLRKWTSGSLTLTNCYKPKIPASKFDELMSLGVGTDIERKYF